MKRLLGTILGLMAVAAPAQAQVITTHGTILGQECYLRARAGSDPQRGLEVCTLALTRQTMGLNDRAATFDNRGVILDRMNRTDEADADFISAITLRPDLGDAYVNRGAVLIKKQQYAEALTQIDQGIRYGTSFPHIAEYNRALALQLLGRYRESYEGYRKVLLLEPGYTQATERLGEFTVIRKPGATRPAAD